MTQALSGVTVVIIIGLGVLMFLILFIFAKRQIMRFALRSRRGPHVPIGHDARKALKNEIERRIDLIPRIMCEPRLFHHTNSRYILYPGQQIPAHYYRLKAVDDIKLLESEITRQDSCLIRHPSEKLRSYLMATLAAPLNGCGHRLIDQFCDLYEHARYDPSNFGDDEYQTFNRLLMKLLDAAKMIKNFNSSRKSSPIRTPQKSREKNKNLLDPSRLKPAVIIPDNDVLGIAEIEISKPYTLAIPTSVLDNSETSV